MDERCARAIVKEYQVLSTAVRVHGVLIHVPIRKSIIRGQLFEHSTSKDCLDLPTNSQ